MSSVLFSCGPTPVISLISLPDTFIYTIRTSHSSSYSAINIGFKVSCTPIIIPPFSFFLMASNISKPLS